MRPEPRFPHAQVRGDIENGLPNNLSLQDSSAFARGSQAPPELGRRTSIQQRLPFSGWEVYLPEVRGRLRERDTNLALIDPFLAYVNHTALLFFPSDAVP